MENLTFKKLREANTQRSFDWMGSIEAWSLSDWSTAMMGEGGEACNVIKKLNRYQHGMAGNFDTKEELLEKLAEELADTCIYLDLLAARAGIDLEDAVVKKFNKVSMKRGFPQRL